MKKLEDDTFSYGRRKDTIYIPDFEVVTGIYGGCSYRESDPMISFDCINGINMWIYDGSDGVEDKDPEL